MFLTGILHNMNITVYFGGVRFKQNPYKNCIALDLIFLFSIHWEMLILKGISVLPKIEAK